MTTTFRRLVLLLAAIGLVTSLTSLYVHHQLLTDPSYRSFCDINATVSCTQAYLSPYGSFHGVPVALFGALWFAFVLVLVAAALVGPPALQDSVPGYLFVTSTIGLAVILYLGYAAFFVLKAVCVMCLITYVVVIGLFIISGIATSLPMTTLPKRAVGDLRGLVTRPAALVLLLVFAIVAASALVFYPRTAAATGQAAAAQAPAPTADQRTEFERYYESLPRVTVPVPTDGAAVVIVKFTDLQCPSCSQSFFADRPIISKYQAEYPGQVKFIAKDYPLQPECNTAVLRPVHQASCDAAAAVRMARAKGKGDALEEWFYAHQPEMSPASVRDAARNVGGVTDFDTEFPRAIEQVKSDASLGRLLNVHVTPTFFINGVKIEGGLAPQYMDMAIALELKKAGKLK